MSAFATRHADVYHLTAREVARRIALSSASLVYRFTGRIPALLLKPRVHILNLHHLFDDERSQFRKLLGELARIHSFVTYSEALSRIHGGQIDRPYLAFSFDDGLKSCLAAAEILDEFGAKACFFVNTSMVGVADFGQIEAFCRARLGLPPCEFMSWSDLQALAARGHEVGSHSHTHLDLAKASPEQLESELSLSREAIAQQVSPPKHFSWPWGTPAHFSTRAADAVFKAGFISCASGLRGCHVMPAHAPRSLCLRRDHVIARWPIDHVLFFMARSSSRASAASNVWPPLAD